MVRVAVRAILWIDDKLLLVNAYNTPNNDLWVAPGGGVEAHSSLTENLERELLEEVGIKVLCKGFVGLDEFHSKETDFHQIDIYFRVEPIDKEIDHFHVDPSGTVHERKLVTLGELQHFRFKPDILPQIACQVPMDTYDPLEDLIF